MVKSRKIKKMRTLRSIIFVAFAALAITLTSCSKDEGFEGNATINGKVTYTAGTASGAIVSIKFGASESSTAFDYSTVTDASGNYSFEGLTKGDYFVDATFTDDLNNTFETGGSHVEIGGNKSDVTVDLVLE